jgi:hypothetical protein
MCALVREGPGRGHSNALACSRDDRDLAGQVQVHGCSLGKASVTSLPVLSWLAGRHLDHLGHARIVLQVHGWARRPEFFEQT